MNKFPDLQDIRAISGDINLRGERRVSLVIGDMSQWVGDGRDVPSIDGFHFADFRVVDRRLIEKLCPSIVMSPLISAQFDAVDVAQKLEREGYRGRYCAVSEQVGNREAVIAELKSAAPALNVDLFILPPQAANG